MKLQFQFWHTWIQISKNAGLTNTVLCTIDQKVKHQGFPGRHFHSGQAQHLVNHCHLLKRCGVDLSGVKMEDMIYNKGTFYVLIK